MGNLIGKTALITGSGDGMGRAHAVLMASRGADIVVNDIKPEMAEETARMVKAVGRKVQVFVADMGDAGAVKKMAADAQAAMGKIVNIASIWGMTGAPVASHYCAAKGALLGFTKAWAKELAPWNIHVNAVAPGGVRSGGPTKLDNPEVLRAKEERVPLKRYCEPVEISYAVAYLASPESDFVTGQVISPNGGETIVGF